MPDSEQSFSDRAQKARDLHAACNKFSPVYSPPPLGVTLGAFMQKIVACEGLNDAVVTHESNWSDGVQQRITTAATIKTTATQLLNYIKSSTAWKSKCPAAKRFADAIRGIKHPRKPAPPPAPGATAAAPRQRGGQSYAELETNWRGLVNLAAGLPGFAPTDAKIQTGTISGLLSTLKGLNGQISSLEAALSEAQMDRQKAYFKAEEGLEFLFTTLKTTVKGQYGTSSSQWAQVKGSRW